MTKEEFKQIFAGRLNILKNERDLTYREIERQTGIPRSCLRMWTLAEVGPSGYYVVALSEFFGVSTDWLLGMSEERSRTAT